MVFVIVVVERKDLEMEAHAMKKTFFTITGTKYYYGSKFFEPGMRVQLIKDKENQYDREAIQVNVKGLGKVGYVANSPYTVLGESMSAGRLYDKIGNKAIGTVVYVLDNGILCSIDNIAKKKYR